MSAGGTAQARGAAARRAAAFGAGLLFALGLGLSGMTRPEKVVGFLDVTRAWDPSLACVMGGAVLVALVGFRLALARGAPRFDQRFHLPTQRAIDARLVAGAAIFGVGWGLSGYCPGPALMSLVTGAPAVLVFVAAMLAGVAAVRWYAPLARAKRPRPSAAGGATPA